MNELNIFSKEFVNITDWSAIFLSIKVALMTSVIALPAAVILGYILARKDFHGKIFLEGFIQLPMVMPPVTTGYILLLVFGTKGVIGSWLFDVFGIRIAFTFSAAVIAAIVVSFPLIIRSIKVSMEMVDPQLEQASLTLGASSFRTFLLITLPLSAPGIAGGFILAFARSLGEFGATVTFAGNIAGDTRTLPLAIYAKMQVPGQEKQTFILVGFSIVISFAAMICSDYFYKRRKAMLEKRRFPQTANSEDSRIVKP